MDYSALTALIVEDDPDIARLVRRCLDDIPMKSVTAGTNVEAKEILATETVDLIILDLGLPDGDGLMLARDVASNTNIGVIILTGRSEVTDRVIGLEIGADDYVTKPFERIELNARVKSLARRLKATDQAPPTELETGEIRFSGWTLDRDQMHIRHRDGRAHDISASEFQLLSMFLDRPGRILSRDQIMDFLFDTAAPAYDRSIDVRISRLRSKLEVDAKHPTIIVTARNMGYIFRGRVGE